MTTYDFRTVDVFAEAQFGGNPLAVFYRAEGLDDARMAALAREFNYSEITFVLPPSDPSNTARVRIFLPTAEIPFAGHPNVGTAFVLAQLAEERGERPNRFVFEELAGLVPIDLLRNANGTLAGAELSAPQPLSIGETIDPAIIAACIGLQTDQIAMDRHPPLIASVGTSLGFAELRDVDALRRAKPDHTAFAKAAERYKTGSVPLFLHLHVRDGDVLRTRMFAPLNGVIEDPATGAANVTLAALLTSLPGVADGTHAYDILQGVEMGRPSRLHATATREGGKIVRATVGGQCVPVLTGAYHAP